MKIIYGNRQSGRTTELIKMCSQDRYSLIVCPNIYMCNSVYQLSRKLGYRITMPITIHQFASGQFKNKQVENFYFDELESCLQSLGGNVPVKAFVFNKQFTEIEEVKTGMTEKTLKKANEIQNAINKLTNEIRTLKSMHGNMIWESKNPPTNIVVINRAEIEYLINVRVEKANRLKKQLKELKQWRHRKQLK